MSTNAEEGKLALELESSRGRSRSDLPSHSRLVLEDDFTGLSTAVCSLDLALYSLSLNHSGFPGEEPR